MNNKLSIVVIFVLGLASLLGSCADTNDNNQVSQEWIDHQENVYYNTRDSVDASGVKLYKSLESMSGDGYVYHKPSDYITKRMELAGSISTRVTEDGKPDTTDEVEVRYEGWFLDMDGKKVIFDSTESANNVGESRKFKVSDVVAGFSDILQDMKPGDEKIVCMPHYLAYGVYGRAATASNPIGIPGYTTLYFDIKLLKVL